MTVSVTITRTPPPPGPLPGAAVGGPGEVGSAFAVIGERMTATSRTQADRQMADLGKSLDRIGAPAFSADLARPTFGQAPDMSSLIDRSVEGLRSISSPDLSPAAAGLSIAAARPAAPSLSSALGPAAKIVGRAAPVVGAVALAREATDLGSIPNDAKEAQMRAFMEERGARLGARNLRELAEIERRIAGGDRGQPEGFDRAPDLPRPPGLAHPTLPESQETLEIPDASGLPPPTTAGARLAPGEIDRPEGFTPADPELTGPVTLEHSGWGPTRPTGPIGGRPAGVRKTNDEDAAPHKKAETRTENEVHDAFAAAGYSVVMQPKLAGALTAERMEAEGLKGDKDPDQLVEGRIFEIYAPVTGDPEKIYSGIQEKIAARQTHRISLNLLGSGLTDAEICRALKEHPIAGLEEVLTLTDYGVGRAWP